MATERKGSFSFIASLIILLIILSQTQSVPTTSAERDRTTLSKDIWTWYYPETPHDPNEILYEYAWVHETLSLKVSTNRIKVGDTITVAATCTYDRVDGRGKGIGGFNIELSGWKYEVISMSPPMVMGSEHGQFGVMWQNSVQYPSPTTFTVTMRITGKVKGDVWHYIGSYVRADMALPNTRTTTDYVIVNLNPLLPDIPLPPQSPTLPDVLKDSKQLEELAQSNPSLFESTVRGAVKGTIGETCQWFKGLDLWHGLIDRVCKNIGLPTPDTLLEMNRVEKSALETLIDVNGPFEITGDIAQNLKLTILSIDQMNARLSQGSPDALTKNAEQIDEIQPNLEVCLSNVQRLIDEASSLSNTNNPDDIIKQQELLNQLTMIMEATTSMMEVIYRTNAMAIDSLGR